MNRRMCFHIVVCALLSSSVAIFSMDKGTPVPHNSVNVSPQSEPSFLDKVEDVEGKILDHVKTVDNVLHGIIHEGLEDVQKDKEVIAKIMVTAKMKQQDAENMTGTVVQVAGLVETADDDLHDIIQGIGKAQISPKITDTTTTK